MRSKVPLSEIAEIVMGQSPIKSDVNSLGNGDALLNGPTEFGSRYPSPVQYTTNGKRFSKHGDILFCVRGSTTGRMNYSDQKYAIGRGLAAIRGKNGIPTPVVKALIENGLPSLLQAATGSTFPNVSKDLLNTFMVEHLSVREASELNKLITSIEDKIFNNTQMNQTLEKIAQRIFKSWFIDFDPVKANAEGVPFDGLSPDIQSLFPSEFVESEMGLIPKGWKASTIGKEFDVTMGQSPPGTSYNETGEGSLFFQGRRDFGFRYPSERVYTTSPKRMANEGDTLLSVRAPVGDVNKALKDCCIGRGVGALRHKSGCSSYTYYSAMNLSRIFEGYDKEGTVFGSINQTDLKALKVLAPSSDILKAFREIVSPLDEKIAVNTKQILALQKMRDRLLPKLLSGSIEINTNLAEAS